MYSISSWASDIAATSISSNMDAVYYEKQRKKLMTFVFQVVDRDGRQE
jgi:hypothetical protein